MKFPFRKKDKEPKVNQPQPNEPTEVTEVEAAVVETTPGSVTINLIASDINLDDFKKETEEAVKPVQERIEKLEKQETSKQKVEAKQPKTKPVKVKKLKPRKKKIDIVKLVKTRIEKYSNIFELKVAKLIERHKKEVKLIHTWLPNMKKKLDKKLAELIKNYEKQVELIKKQETNVELRKNKLANLKKHYEFNKHNTLFVFEQRLKFISALTQKRIEKANRKLQMGLFKVKEKFLVFIFNQDQILKNLEFKKETLAFNKKVLAIVHKFKRSSHKTPNTVLTKELNKDKLVNQTFNKISLKIKQDKLKAKQKALAQQKALLKNQPKSKDKPLSAYQANKTPYAVEMHHISKSFHKGQLLALDDVTLKVAKNEIHAIVGENGAGKTTLMSILFGQIPADEGKVYVNGQLSKIKTPDDATKNGIGMVHQHFKLVNVYSLLDNIILGAEKTKNGFIDRSAAIEKINKITKAYNLKLNLDTKVRYASVGEQQTTEIVKLLYRDADILIFDEPTAVLSDIEIAGFLKMLKEFKRLGKTVILITHKLNEVEAVADRVTVIRKGCVVDTVVMKKTNQNKLANMMVGEKLVLSKNNVRDLKYSTRPVVCNIENLYANKISQPKVLALKGLNLKIHAGEIVGLAGIEGNGQTELALIIGGLLKNKVRGKVEIYNELTNVKLDALKTSTDKLYRHGLTHVPEDRLKYGLVLDETVAINTVLPRINEDPFTVLGMLNHKAINGYTKNLLFQWDVRGANNGKALARSLSGGNQQKLVIGREISRPHCFSIYVQPTRGLDLGAIQNVHKQIMEDAKKGVGVLLISYELDEILAISSRIAVINDGKITFHALRHKTNRQEIGRYLGSNAKSVSKKGNK